MIELKPCPFCGGEAKVEMDESWYWEYAVSCTKCFATINLYFAAEEEAAEAWNKRASELPKKSKPEVDLTGKCGSCRYGVPAENVFGNSKCYVRCTNEEHLSSRRYYGRPLVAVRQRTAKACKRYEGRADNAADVC